MGVQQYFRRKKVNGGGAIWTHDYEEYELLYSVARRLREAYTGALIRIRRDSDNSELDIGYDSSNELDVSAISSFCSGTTGRLQKMYNQGTDGSSHDATYFSGTRSLIFQSGNIIVDSDNLKPAILGQTNNRYDCSNKDSSESYMDRERIESSVFRTPNSAVDGTIYAEFDTGVTSRRFATSCDTTTARQHQNRFVGIGANVLLNVQATQNQLRQHSLIQFNPSITSANIRPFWNGNLQVDRSEAFRFPADRTIRGLFMYYSNATHMQGYFQERAMRLTGGSNEETELRALEAEQNLYYGIY